MKTKLLLVLFLSFIFTLGFTQSHEQPTTPPYEGYEICVNKISEHYWVYGSGGKHGKGLYHDFNGWKFVKYDEQTYGKIIGIVGDYGKVYVRTNKDKVLYWGSQNSQWIEMKGINKIKDIAWNGNHLFVIGTVNPAGSNNSYGVSQQSTSGTAKTGIFKTFIAQKASDWTPIRTDVLGSSFIRLDILQQTLYAVTSDKKLYITSADPSRQAQGRYLTGYPQKQIIDVCKPAGPDIYIEDATGKVFLVRNNPKSYVEMKYSGSSWAVSDKGNVYGINNGMIEMVSNGVYSRLDVENPNRILSDGSTPLTQAIKSRNPNSIEKVFKDGADPNALDRNGNPPIVLAAQARSSSFTASLIKNKADVNKLDKSGYSALYFACKNNFSGNVKLLLDNGADPNQKGIVDEVVKNKNTQVIEMFVAKNADLSKGYVIAAQNNDADAFRIFANAGVKQNGLEAFKKATENSNTEIAGLALDNGASSNEALKYALERNSIPIIGVCLERGANPDPAVSYAVSKNNTELCYQLISLPTVGPDKLLSASLSPSTGSINTNIADLALQNGADPNKQVKSAVNTNQKSAVDLLIRHNADPNLVLKESVYSNKFEFAKLAVNSGASGVESSTMSKAIDHKNTALVDLLISAGGNASDPSLISKSVSMNHTEITSLLINNGASANDPQLISTAVKANNIEISKLLLTNGASASNGNLIKTSVTNKNLEMSKLLVANGASCTDPGLMKIAVNGSDFETSSFLIQNGASATDPELIKSAVKANNTQIIKLLIDNNAPVTGKGLVEMSAGHNNIQVVKMLVEKGADANDGIEAAVSKNATDIAIYLLDKGASASSPVLMQQAAGYGNLVLVKKLFENGADVNNGTMSAIKNKNAQVLSFLVDQGAMMTTPEYMYRAVEGNNDKIFEIVQAANAPNTWKAPNGDNLLHLIAAMKSPSFNIITKLASGGVDINAKNNNGDTPLLVALDKGRNEIELCQTLVLAGADASIPNKKGKPPYKVAKGRKVTKYLKSLK